MDKINTKSIRNVCLMGHGGSGKTSLCEAMLYLAKATDRLGRTPEGNTVSDYDAEEIKRGFSLSTSIDPLMWKDIKINIIDTPGYLDFAGEVARGHPRRGQRAYRGRRTLRRRGRNRARVGLRGERRDTEGVLHQPL